MSKEFFNIAKPKDDNTNIWINGFIGNSWFGESTTAQEFIAKLENVTTDKITILLNSRGGSVPDGIAILNALLAHPAHVTTINAASAMSIASIILQAGDKRISFKNAVTMVHDCSSQAGGNAGKLREAADVLDKFNKTLKVTYEAKGISEENIESMLDGHDHYFNADEARNIGLVDEVIDASEITASLDTPLIPDHLKHEIPTMTKPTKPEANAHEEKKTLLSKIGQIFAASEPEEPIEPKAQKPATQSHEDFEKDVAESIQAVAEKIATQEQTFAKKSDVDEVKNTLNQINQKFDSLNAELEKESGSPRPIALGNSGTSSEADEQVDC